MPVNVTVAVATVKPSEVYVSVYVVPIVPSTPRLLNVATPEDAVAVGVPTKVPPALIVAVTMADEEITVLLSASRMVICGWVEKAVLRCVPIAARVIATLVGVPGSPNARIGRT